MKNNNQDDNKAYVYITKDTAYKDTCLTASNEILYKGTPVIFDTKHGLDLGHILDFARTDENPYKKGCTCIRGANMEDIPCSCGYEHNKKVEIKKSVVQDNVTYIDHVAKPEEVAKYNENLKKEDTAMEVCTKSIKKYKLSMKLIACHFLVGENKVIFFFISEDRVDFRELVKELSQIFKMRIELRQVGAREQAKFLGGLSVCGYDFCCHTNNNTKNPVTIKMAKEQNLSLNAAKVSGPCNKILCCVSNESKNTKENNIEKTKENAKLPEEGVKIKIAKDLWTVVKAAEGNITLVKNDKTEQEIPVGHLYFEQKNKRWKIDREYLSLYIEDNKEEVVEE